MVNVIKFYRKNEFCSANEKFLCSYDLPAPNHIQYLFFEDVSMFLRIKVNYLN